jgi:hypothetical protein
MTNPTPHDPWSRLTRAARQIRDDRDTSAPYGFSTRVAALALAMERRGASVVDRLAWRALGVAGLVALFSVVLNYRELAAFTQSAPLTPLVVSAAPALEYEPFAHDDAVSIVLNLAD